MKISYNWLKQYIDIDLSAEAMGDILTQTGLEVEGIERVQRVPGGLEGLVVGEVLDAWKHPEADRLKLTKVNVGNGEDLQIVCGAPNVEKGQKVIVATVGTMLYPADGDPFKIKKGKIRGEESHGMICAEDEIGLGNSHDGIMVLDAATAVGTPASKHFNLEDDFCIEIGLTPNRTDGMSHLGVARDLAAALNHMEGIENCEAKVQPPSVDAFEPTNDTPIEVDVRSTEGAPRYAGVCISGLTVGPSPDWLQDRLKAIGLSTINNIVDITNFVQHETGQPLHAFDIAEIADKKVIVDTLPEGTKFITLDEQERKLGDQDLMICNGNVDSGKLDEAGMCIAGVFGGIKSGVSEKTTDVFLESAYFNPVWLRKTAKKHTLNTDASFRFERGVDPNMTLYALKRAALLMCEIAGGQISSAITDIYPKEIQRCQVKLSLTRMTTLIGSEIPKNRVLDILGALDIEVADDQGDKLDLLIPTYRTDVTREADVVEEILRIYGYNAIPLPKKLNISINHNDDVDEEKMRNHISDLLVAQGFTEMMSNSLSHQDYAAMLDDEEVGENNTVHILNPLSSDLGVMRQSLVFQGLEAIARNINHRNADLRLFEFGRVYAKHESEYRESQRLAIFITGRRDPESWNTSDDAATDSQIRAAIESVLSKLGMISACKMEDGSKSWMASSKALTIGPATMGYFGRIGEDLCKKFDVDQPVFYAELNWDEVLAKGKMNKTKFKALSKYPAVRRDLSLLLDEATTFKQVDDIARKAGKKLLRKTGLFDVYEGKNLPAGKKSYAVSFIFQDDSATLKDKQVDGVMNQIIKNLQDQLSAELR